MIAYGVHETGRREVIGLDVGEIESEAFWREFLRSLRRRGLDGVRAVRLRRPRGPQERDRQGARLPVAALHGALRQRHAPALPPVAARARVGRAARGLQRRRLRPGARARERGDRAARADRAEGRRAARRRRRATCSRSTASRAEHWSKLRSTNPLERVNREIGRRSDVVGIFPNDASLIRLAGMLLIEQNDEWLVGRRYLSQESLAALAAPETELSGDYGPGNGAISTGKGKENGKGGHRPRRLRARARHRRSRATPRNAT